jgi:hypothetical protein
MPMEYSSFQRALNASVKTMESLLESGDVEAAHERADELLCELGKILADRSGDGEVISTVNLIIAAYKTLCKRNGGVNSEDDFYDWTRNPFG